MPKTSLDLPEGLLSEAKQLAARERTTLRALVEAGLRTVLDRRGRSEQFRLRDASVDGRGVEAEFRGAGWERVRDAAYEGRGT